MAEQGNNENLQGTRVVFKVKIICSAMVQSKSLSIYFSRAKDNSSVSSKRAKFAISLTLWASDVAIKLEVATDRNMKM